jgi:hypothetical protein
LLLCGKRPDGTWRHFDAAASNFLGGFRRVHKVFLIFRRVYVCVCVFIRIKGKKRNIKEKKKFLKNDKIVVDKIF